jgi:hypothetical protein
MPVDEVDAPSSPTRVARRAFLRKAATGFGASAILSIPGVGSAAAATTLKKTRTAYRLSSHGLRACSACVAHAANRFYIGPNAANNDRAHLGCNCGIVTQELAKSTWSCYFRRGLASVYDLRWHRPRCPRP